MKITNLQELEELREEISTQMIEADSDSYDELEEKLYELEQEIDYQKGYHYGLES